MKTNKDKSLILNEIKLHYGFKSDAEFAKFLGVKPATLSNWHTRNTFDYERIYTICKHIDANWLLTGEGNMLKSHNERNISTEENNIIKDETLPYQDNEDYKEKYIQLLEKYNQLLEGRISDWLDSKKKS